MKGEKIATAIKCIMELVRDVLRKDDGVALVIFAAQAEHIDLGSSDGEGFTRKADLGPDCAHMEKIMKGVSRPGHSTALWDGLFKGADLLFNRERRCRPNPSHPALVILTDGKDNASELTAGFVQELVENPGHSGYSGFAASNFHMDFITVGKHADISGARHFCSKPHLKHIHALNISGLKQAFRQQVRRRLLADPRFRG